jgi:argonaute-like protein implicated in RNA metabolism and viral defense
MNPDNIKWVLGALGSAVVVVVGAIVWLNVASYRIGRMHLGLEVEAKARAELSTQLKDVADRLRALDMIAAKVEQLEESHAELRKRFTSDFPDVVSKVDQIWAKVFSLQEWRKSQGRFGE